MKNFISFFAFFVIFILIGCKKSKYQTKPQIKVTSTSNKVVPPGGFLYITLEYTDKEGDLSDSMIFIKKVWKNQRLPSSFKANTIPYKLPHFPNEPQGEIQLNLNNTTLTFAEHPNVIPGTNPEQKEPDTLDLKIWVKDRANNISDTVVVDNVVVINL